MLIVMYMTSVLILMILIFNSFLTVKEDNMLVNYYLSYYLSKREKQRMMNRNKYLNVSTAVYFLVKLGSKN